MAYELSLDLPDGGSLPQAIVVSLPLPQIEAQRLCARWRRVADAIFPSEFGATFRPRPPGKKSRRVKF
jgi:hypothetical protein